MSVTPASPPAVAPVLLALDTATDRIHAALVTARGDVRAIDLPGGAQASATLLPALSALLQQAGLDWPDVDALAYGAGPGAFTGLRTACATIQGLALGLGKPVIALDTLMAVAEDARQAGGVNLAAPLWVMQDARMGELYAACYQWTDADACWQVVQGPQLWPLAHPLSLGLALDVATDPTVATQAAAVSAATARPQWAGNALQADPTLLAPLSATQCAGCSPAEDPGVAGATASSDTPAAPRAAQPTGAALAALALAAWRRGEWIDAALALPRYVRDKVAQTTAERQQARA